MTELTSGPHTVTLAPGGITPKEGVTLTLRLTDRQQQILDRLNKGLKPAEVGEDLGISRNAVYQHITSLKRAGVLEDQRAPLHDDNPLTMAAHSVTRAEQRIAQITEQETQLQEERRQLEAFVKRNRDLIPA